MLGVSQLFSVLLHLREVSFYLGPCVAPSFERAVPLYSRVAECASVMLDGILDYEKSTTVSGKLRWPGTIHREHGSVGGVRGWWLERRLLCGGDKV